MPVKRLQNRIAESRWSFLNMGIVALVVWLLAGLSTLDVSIAAPFVCLLVTSILIAELNNYNALIRIYSRMVSCSFVVFATIATFLFTNIQASLVTLCVAIFYNMVFRSYQNTNSPGFIFQAFLAIGLASIFWVQILFFLPVLWIVLATNLLAMSPRNFVASLLGIITPYWVLVAWYALNDNLMAFIEHFTAIADFGPLASVQALTINEVVTMTFVVLAAITGIVHFARNAQRDNVRTRLLYETFITADIIAFIFFILQPQHYAELFGIIAINTAPLTGHFIALTHTKWTNAFFLVMLFVAALITAFNMLMPAMQF